MKSKTGLVILVSILMLSPQTHATIYNTGYSVTSTANGIVDNLWQITSVANLPSGYTLPQTPPFSALKITSGQSPLWDTSNGSSGSASSWISFASAASLPQPDASGVVTTFTLNFNAPIGTYQLGFEADNYISIYLGAVSPANQIYSDVGPEDFYNWHVIPLTVTTPGINQLNLNVFNGGVAGLNYNPMGLRADFVVPEPSALTFVAIGSFSFLFFRQRLKR